MLLATFSTSSKSKQAKLAGNVITVEQTLRGYAKLSEDCATFWTGPLTR